MAGLNKNEFNEFTTENGEYVKLSPGDYNIESPQIGIMPFREQGTSKITGLASFAAFPMEHKDDPTKVHNIVFMLKANSKKELEFYAVCGDNFISGKLGKKSDPEKQMDEALMFVDKGDPEDARSAMSSSFGSVSTDSGCGFWKSSSNPIVLSTGNSAMHCKHIKYLLKENETLFSSGKVVDILEDELGRFSTAIAAPTPGTRRKRKSKFEPTVDSLAFKVPVMIEGDRGSGKTFEARTFAKANSYKEILLAGHNSIESADLIGYLLPDGTGSLVWMDGPLAEAFRSASKGNKTVLIIDEILRIPEREMSILLSALTPFNGCYTLRTNNVTEISEDFVAEVETIECPVSNLAIVATTNIGGQYAVSDIDPALAERFVIIRKDTDMDKLKDILIERLREKGFTLNLADKILGFYEGMKNLKENELIKETPTTRTLTRAIDLVEKERDIGKMLSAQSLLWVDRDLDGFPIEAEQEAVSKAIKDSGLSV